MIIGYARVSTKEQNIDTQIELLKQNGCEKTFSDIGISGVKEERPGLTNLLEHIRTGDTVLVYKIDRIFRSLKHLVNLIEKFNEMGVSFKSITEPVFDTTTSGGMFLFQIFGAVAEFERNLIRERTMAGLENARKRKKLLGRPSGIKKETIDKYKYANYLYEKDSIPIDDACKQANISKSTFYRLEKILNTEIH